MHIQIISQTLQRVVILTDNLFKACYSNMIPAALFNDGFTYKSDRSGGTTTLTAVTTQVSAVYSAYWFFPKWNASTEKHYGNNTLQGNKCMVSLFVIDTLWLSFLLRSFHFYLWDDVLTLCEGRVTQTWLMRPYWLWLLWQLLIRDWVQTVAIRHTRWTGRNGTSTSAWAPSSQPTHTPTHSSVQECVYLTTQSDVH